MNVPFFKKVPPTITQTRNAFTSYKYYFNKCMEMNMANTLSTLKFDSFRTKPDIVKIKNKD